MFQNSIDAAGDRARHRRFGHMGLFVSTAQAPVTLAQRALAARHAVGGGDQGPTQPGRTLSCDVDLDRDHSALVRARYDAGGVHQRRGTGKALERTDLAPDDGRQDVPNAGNRPQQFNFGKEGGVRRQVLFTRLPLGVKKIVETKQLFKALPNRLGQRLLPDPVPPGRTDRTFVRA